jgi:hypothetical protein
MKNKTLDLLRESLNLRALVGVKTIKYNLMKYAYEKQIKKHFFLFFHDF